MANDIERKDLWRKLNNIKNPKDWERAGARLEPELIVLSGSSGGKGPHCIFWDPKFIDDRQNINGLIATIQTHIYKEVNESIFKKVKAFGIPEDDIWKALKML